MPNSLRLQDKRPLITADTQGAGTATFSLSRHFSAEALAYRTMQVFGHSRKSRHL